MQTTDTSDDLHAWLKLCQKQVDNFLQDWLPVADNSGSLFEAMRYSALASGKRLRPALVYTTATLGNKSIEDVSALGGAVECIHAYSLSHDDLPAMDDDDLRRGQPTCHIAYDEATAILVGDALQAIAFDILARAHVPDLDAATRLQIIQSLTKAASLMVAGQAIDITGKATVKNLTDLAELHDLKTGALICASVEIGALAGGLKPEEIATLTQYGKMLGRAFQVMDDYLDVTASSATLGKPKNSDISSGKITYTSLLGVAGALEEATRLKDAAVATLDGFDGSAADCLRSLAHFTVARKN